MRWVTSWFLVLLATKRAFLHPVVPAITSLLLSCQWTDLTGCDQNLIYWTRLHAKSCVQILFVSEFDVYWHWFLRFEHAWLVCWTTTACRYRTALGLYDSCMSTNAYLLFSQKTSMSLHLWNLQWMVTLAQSFFVHLQGIQFSSPVNFNTLLVL